MTDQTFDSYTPWCGHCKSLAPSFEMAKEAISTWDPELVHSTEFGEMNCELHPNECLKLNVSAYPSLKFYNNEGNPYLEYPRLPRTPESLTAYLAKYRRKVEPYPLLLLPHYANETCIPKLRFKDSLCRAFRIENYLIGSKKALSIVNENFSNVAKGMLEFYEHPRVESDEVCVLDRFTHEKRGCVKTSAKDLDWVGEFKAILQLHRHPYVVTHTTWFDFFSMKNAASDRKIALFASDVGMEPTTDLAKKYLQNYNFMIVDRADDTYSVFHQVEEGNGGILVLEPSAYDKGFYHLPSERIDHIEKWLDDILLKRVVKRYPPGHRSLTKDLIHTLSTFHVFVGNVLSHMSLRRQIQAILVVFLLTFAWVYTAYTSHEEGTSSRISTKCKKITTTASDTHRIDKRKTAGVCLINGKIRRCC